MLSRIARRTRPVAVLAAVAATLPACATVRQDEVGVKRTMGRISQRPVMPGAQVIAPGFQSVLRVPVRTVNREVRLDLPTKEGLNVGADVSILYRIKPEMAPQVLAQSGLAYEEAVILPVFRSSSSDVSARFMAKDLHSGERAVIERAIQQQMMQALEARGFVIENVLLKSIRLPGGLAQAVEQKLEAEQRAQQMQFVLETERQEADRKRVEAEGIRDAQKIISEGLSATVLQYQSIQAMRELAASPNAKLVLTDGRTPFLYAPADASGMGLTPVLPTGAPRGSVMPAATPRREVAPPAASAGRGAAARP